MNSGQFSEFNLQKRRRGMTSKLWIFLSFLLLSYFFYTVSITCFSIHCLRFEWKWKKKQFDDAVANIIIVVTKEKSLKVNDTKILNSTFTIEMLISPKEKAFFWQNKQMTKRGKKTPKLFDRNFCIIFSWYDWKVESSELKKILIL